MRGVEDAGLWELGQKPTIQPLESSCHSGCPFSDIVCLHVNISGYGFITEEKGMCGGWYYAYTVAFPSFFFF